MKLAHWRQTRRRSGMTINQLRSIAFGILSLAIALSQSGCDRKPTGRVLNVTVPADYVTHTTEDGTVSFKAPPTWKAKDPIKKKDIVLNVMADDGMSSVNVYRGPAVTGNDRHRLGELVIRDLKTVAKNFKINSTETIQVDGVDCPRIDCQGEAMGVLLQFQVTAVPKEGHVYVITCTAMPV